MAPRKKSKTLQETTPSMLKHVAPPTQDAPASAVHSLAAGDPKQRADVLRQFRSSGSLMNQNTMRTMMSQLLMLNFRRRQFYRELENCYIHAYVSGAVGLYADFITGKSSINGASVWVQSKDKTVENVGNALFARIGIEERIRDWATKLCVFGDMFIQPIGREGLGIEFVDDAIHPGDMDRVDINGRLEGFMRCDFASLGGVQSGEAKDLDPPWAYVHFKTFGSFMTQFSTSFGLIGDATARNQMSGVMLSARERANRVTTRYGTSVIAPAVPIYKSLKLSEDSVQLARVTRGMLFYLYKVRISGGWDQASEILTEYRELLKRQTGIDFSKQEWRDTFSPVYAQVEDLFIPETDDMSVTAEEMGGHSVDIKGIRDIEMLESRLLGALRVSKMLLGITDDMPSSIGNTSADRISINFAKNVSRVQASLGYGLKRLVQLELAYLGYNADPTRFDIVFGTISTAEEEELKNGLETGVKIVGDFMTMMSNAFGDDNLKKSELMDMLNKKILKLEDIKITDYVNDKTAQAGSVPVNDSVVKAQKKINEETETPQLNICESLDLYSYLPAINVDDTMRGRLKESKKGSRAAMKYSLIENKLAGNVSVMKESAVWVTRKVRIVPEEVAK